MALLTYDWHPPDPTGAVNAYLSGLKIGVGQEEFAQKLAADALEQARLRKRFEDQHALQLQQEARLAGAEQLRQSYHAAAAQQKASDILAQRTAGDALTSALFPNPALPSGGVVAPVGAAPSVAQSLIAPDPSDPLIGQAPPVDPQDNATADDYAAGRVVGQDALPVGDVPQITPAEMLAMGKSGQLMKPTLAPAPPDLSRGAASALPAGPGATPASQLLAPMDGVTPVAKPSPGTPVPNVAAALFQALPPKEKIAVAKQVAAARLAAATKQETAAAKPDPLRRMPDGSLARVGADNTVTTIATKPPAQVTPTAALSTLVTERAQYQGEASKAQLEMDKMLKGKDGQRDPREFSYPWKEGDKLYKFDPSNEGKKPVPITQSEYDAQMALAHRFDGFKQKIIAAEGKMREMEGKIAAARHGGAPAAASPSPAASDPLASARAAIAAGAPRDAVVKRLREAGIDPSGL